MTEYTHTNVLGVDIGTWVDKPDRPDLGTDIYVYPDRPYWGPHVYPDLCDWIRRNGLHKEGVNHG